MKFTKLMLSALAILGLTASVAQARPAHRFHRHHGPRVSFGFNVGQPMYRPAICSSLLWRLLRSTCLRNAGSLCSVCSPFCWRFIRFRPRTPWIRLLTNK